MSAIEWRRHIDRYPARIRQAVMHFTEGGRAKDVELSHAAARIMLPFHNPFTPVDADVLAGLKWRVVSHSFGSGVYPDLTITIEWDSSNPPD